MTYLFHAAEHIGKAFVDGQYVADMWKLPNGLIAACDPGTTILSRNQSAHRKWRRNDNGDWEPAE